MGRRVLSACLLTFPLAAGAERVTIGPWYPDRPWTVQLERDPGVDCTLTPEEVLDRAVGYSIHCTSLDKTLLGHRSGDRRPVWYVNSHGGGTVCPDGRNTGSSVLLDDATGRVLDTTVYPCAEPPKRPEGPPTYTVTVDPGVGCRMTPDEVAEKFGWQGILSLRCTTSDKLWEMWGPEGRDQRVVWVVKMDDRGYVIEDSTGQITAAGGSGPVRRGANPTPEPVAPQE